MKSKVKLKSQKCIQKWSEVKWSGVSQQWPGASSCLRMWNLLRRQWVEKHNLWLRNGVEEWGRVWGAHPAGALPLGHWGKEKQALQGLGVELGFTIEAPMIQLASSQHTLPSALRLRKTRKVLPKQGKRGRWYKEKWTQAPKEHKV